MYRAPPLRIWRRALVAAVVLMVAAPASVSPAVRMGDPLWPLSYLDPFVPIVRGGYLLCHSSCSKPYGIEDLHSYRILLGGRGKRQAIWALWEVRAHPIYRLDELCMRICAEPLPLSLSIALEPLLRREAVQGFPAGLSNELAAVVVLQHGGCALSLRRQLAAGIPDQSTQIAVSLRTDRLSVAAAGSGMGRGLSLLDVEGELALGGSAGLRTGYRLDSDEVRCGLVCRRDGLLVTALWSHHPALGRTVTLGVGYVWER